jgi:hypothetical protein
MPSPSGLQTGIPMGQPNSTVLISSPMRFRSSDESSFSQSRTGSPARLRAIEDGRNPLALSFERPRLGTHARRGFGVLTHGRSVPYTVQIRKWIGGDGTTPECSLLRLREVFYAYPADRRTALIVRAIGSGLERDVVEGELKAELLGGPGLFGIVREWRGAQLNLAAAGEFHWLLQPVALEPLRARTN